MFLVLFTIVSYFTRDIRLLFTIGFDKRVLARAEQTKSLNAFFLYPIEAL